MKRRDVKLVCGVMMVAMSMTLFTGCSKSEKSSTESKVSKENTFEYSDGSDTPTSTTVVGTVTSVDGDEVTLSTMEMPSGGESGDSENGGAGGSAPEIPSGDGGEAPSGEMPSGEAPSGEMPSGDMQNPGGDSSSDSKLKISNDSSDSSSDSTDADSNSNSDKMAGGSAPEKPSGSSDMGNPPSKPSGDSSDKNSKSSDSATGTSTEDAKVSDDSSSDSENSSDSSDTNDDSDSTDAAAPEMPSGDASGSAPADMENNGKEAILTIQDESVITVVDESNNESDGTIESFSEGTMVSITFDEDGTITAIQVGNAMMAGGNGGGGQSSGVDSYDAVTEYTEDTEVSDEDFTSEGTDENAILVSSGAKVCLNNITVDRTSSDSTGGDNSSFYGVGAAILTTDGTSYIKNATISTDAAGGAGVFAYGDGTVYIADSTITTKQNTSGGIHAAGGGTLYAWDLDVTTDGESAAAIRSDRGGGTMVVDGGTYTSNGVGSPAVYCTADIAVNNATLTANGSEAICIEGLNTLNLFDCDVIGNMSDIDTNDTTWDIIVYQSMSGDSEVGNSTFQMVGGSLTSKNGGLLYTTNTECNILMSDVDITYADDSEFFLQCTGNTNERGWGTAGANGSQCTFTGDNQEMKGKVIWDSISNLDFYMENGSVLTGSFEDDETYAGDGGDGYCNVYISEDSKWIVTNDSTVTNLYSKGTIVDEDGNTVSIVGTDGTEYVKGNSQYTITVDKYENSVDLSGAASANSWSDYKVDEPDELK